MSAGKLGLTSGPRPRSTPESGIVALVVIYRRAIERYEEAKESSPRPPTTATQMFTEGVDYGKRECESSLG